MLASVSNGENAKNLTCIKVGGLFLRDTFSRPPCTLIQPSMSANTPEPPLVPQFGENFCQRIYPLENKLSQFSMEAPLICLYSLQINPSPLPPIFASQTVITCQPLMVTLQEESCLRISSFLADGVNANGSSIIPESSINSLEFILKEFDLSIPLNTVTFSNTPLKKPALSNPSFSGARLHIKDLNLSQNPSLKCPLLNLEKDPACFPLWEFQPIDASQMKISLNSSTITLSLETSSTVSTGELFKCVELNDVKFETAMVTADGGPLLEMPPPDGIVRLGVQFGGYLSNTSVEQLFFVLDLYSYFGQVGERITKAGKKKSDFDFSGELIKKLPSDTAVSMVINALELNFLQEIEGREKPLVQFIGEDLFVKVSHRTLGGAFAVSTDLFWKSVSVNCIDDDDINNNFGNPKMKAVFWIDNNNNNNKKNVSQFLDIRVVHVMPYDIKDMEYHSLNVSMKISNVRLGGGMSYTESLLHRFAILGPDGGPSQGLLKGVKELSSGPLAKLFKSSPHNNNNTDNHEGSENTHLELGIPDDLDISIELRNWLFALEGTDEQSISDGWSPRISDDVVICREDRCWHTTFRNLHLSAKSPDNNNDNKNNNSANKISDNCNNKKLIIPVESFLVGVKGLQAIKPRIKNKEIKEIMKNNKKEIENMEGIDIEATVINNSENNPEEDSAQWMVENIKFSVKQPIEAVATKEEIEHLVELCKAEADSMGRITAAILRLLKLEKSLGQATLDQLSSLGSGGVDKVFTPRKLSRQSSFGSFAPSTPTSNLITKETTSGGLEETINLLENEISDSHAKCMNLLSEMNGSDVAKCANEIKELNQKLENMHLLLSRLRGAV